MASIMGTLNPRRLSRPPSYVWFTLIISIGGFLNGYDTGAIGAITTMPQFAKVFGELSPIMRGFTVSFLLLMGAAPAFWAGQLADAFGQLRIVLIGAMTFAVGCALQGGATNLPMLLVGRALAGLGEGLWLTNVSIYITEIAPRTRRGMLVSTPQFMATAGICAGYFTCYGTIHIASSIAWRLPFIIAGLLAVALAISCLYLPVSPRWLQHHGQRDEAIHEAERLTLSRAEIEKDILTTAGQQRSGLSLWHGLSTVFQKQYRARTGLGFFILGMIQLCGIDGVLYYAPILFVQAGLPGGTASFLASGLSAILMLAISVPATMYADRWGRRTSVITGGVGLAGCMYLIGSLYASGSVSTSGGPARWFVIVTIFVFALIYVSTWGLVGKIYASEIQPTQTRAAANSMAQGLNFLTNWLVAFATPIFLARSAYGAYFLFGSLTTFTVIILTIWMPETRGKSLEAIQESFTQSGRRSTPRRNDIALTRRHTDAVVSRESTETWDTLERNATMVTGAA